jgi:trimethylamine--corrinoid protein Co-methyltransferase
VICDEILDWLEHFVSGVEINEETLALDLIDRIGPDGQFLESDHTYQHYRERWYPNLFDRDNYEGWLATGGKTLAERAAQQVDEILARHQPEPLEDEIVQKIQSIVQRGELTSVA